MEATMKLQGIVSDIPMPTESRKERIEREKAEAEAAKAQAKAMKGQPITKPKASLVSADQTVTVIPQQDVKTVIDLPAIWRRIKKQFNKHRGLNITLSSFVMALVLIVAFLSINKQWEQGNIVDQAREQAKVQHQADNKAATPITITQNPTTTSKPDTVTEKKVPGIPATPSKETTSTTTQESTQAITQVPVDTYIIATGDTLWDIAVNLYGDGSRWTEIYEKNKDVIDAQDSRNAVDHGHWIHEGFTLQLE